MERATIYRELGSALFAIGPNQDRSKARQAYQSALGVLSKFPGLSVNYAMDLSELGYFELQSGDWKCGRMLSDYGLSLLDIAAINNQSIAEAAKSFRQSIALITRSGDQPDDGCPYVIAPLSKVSSSLQNAGGKSKVLESVSTEHSD